MVGVNFIPLLIMNRHKRPFVSHAIKASVFCYSCWCAYIPWCTSSAAPIYAQQLLFRTKYLWEWENICFYPATKNMSNFSAALNKTVVKYKGRVGRFSLSAVVWLWLNVSSAVDHWMNEVLRKQRDCVMGVCEELLLSQLIMDQSVIY